MTPPSIQTADSAASLPRLSMLLITYNQARTVEAALQGALGQTYGNLEIIVSDDASTDDTFARVQHLAQSYQGPHVLRIHRNPVNLGIGANLNQAVGLSTGELLVVTAGDDVSVPHRCEVLARTWVDSGKQLDLLAAHLIDMDDQGQLHGTLKPSALQQLRSLNDWLAHRPYVVGAAQAWTRRLFDRFGPFPTGVVAEDLVMVFRAVAAGGAHTIEQPLVHYRRGGLSGKKRNATPQAVMAGWLKSNRHALIESQLLLKDCEQIDCPPSVRAFLQSERDRAHFMARLFSETSRWQRLRFGVCTGGIPWSKRTRLLVYAVCPELLLPFFWLKQMVQSRR